MEWENSVRIGNLLAKKLELRLTESDDGYAGYLTGTKVILGQK